MKNLSLLGSTGSIGCNVLKIVRQFPGRYRIVALAAGNNIALLRDQIEAFHPLVVSVGDRAKAEELERMRPAGWTGEICHGQEGNIRVATLPVSPRPWRRSKPEKMWPLPTRKPW